MQQDPSLHALRHAPQEEEVAMLNSLRHNPVVIKAAEEAGKVCVRGVKGQLGEGQQRGSTPGGRPHLLRLLMAAAVRYGRQHVQGVVKVLRKPQRRQGRQRRERGRAAAREGEGAS